MENNLSAISHALGVFYCHEEDIGTRLDDIHKKFGKNYPVAVGKRADFQNQTHSSMKICESPAEERFYPILEIVCKKLNLDFVCQETVEYPCDYYHWVYDKYDGVLPAWLEAIHDQECGAGCRFCNFWRENELYRIDFVIRKDNTSLKVAIEIDGADYHIKQDDEKRDCRLEEEYGYVVYRIDASDVFFNPLEVTTMLIDFLKLKIASSLKENDL